MGSSPCVAVCVYASEVYASESGPDAKETEVSSSNHNFMGVSMTMRNSSTLQSFISSRKPEKTAIVMYFVRPAVIITNEPEIVMTSEITANLFSS